MKRETDKAHGRLQRRHLPLENLPLKNFSGGQICNDEWLSKNSKNVDFDCIMNAFFDERNYIVFNFCSQCAKAYPKKHSQRNKLTHSARTSPKYSITLLWPCTTSANCFILKVAYWKTISQEIRSDQPSLPKDQCQKLHHEPSSHILTASLTVGINSAGSYTTHEVWHI